jgi:ribosomal protein L14E/L6E/L27E
LQGRYAGKKAVVVRSKHRNFTKQCNFFVHSQFD